MLLEVDFKKETVWLKDAVEKVNSPVVFCHNDMQEGNILICQDENENNSDGEPRIVLIGELFLVFFFVVLQNENIMYLLKKKVGIRRRSSFTYFNLHWTLNKNCWNYK